VISLMVTAGRVLLQALDPSSDESCRGMRSVDALVTTQIPDGSYFMSFCL
jgi:hypothetical protein